MPILLTSECVAIYDMRYKATIINWLRFIAAWKNKQKEEEKPSRSVMVEQYLSPLMHLIF